MCLGDLAGLIETTDDPDANTLPQHCDVEEMVCQGRAEHVLLLFTAQEIRRFYARVLRWQEHGRSSCAPLTPAEVQMLQERGFGASICGIALPSYMAETYRAFCLWYYGVVQPVPSDRWADRGGDALQND